MAFGWIGAATALGLRLSKANTWQVTWPSLAFLTLVQMPAKAARGRLSSRANQIGTFLPSGVVSYSLKDVKGTRLGCPRSATDASAGTSRS